jgi:hypothetical protein
MLALGGFALVSSLAFALVFMAASRGTGAEGAAA